MSAGDSNIMIPASDADIQALSNIQAMRMLSDGQKQLLQTMDRMANQLNSMATDVAVLKAQDMKHEMEQVRRLMREIADESEDKIKVLRQEFEAEKLRRDERINGLLAASVEDRKQLWTANEARKGEIKNLTDRILPIFTAIAAAVAIVISLVLEKVLK